MIHQKSLTIAPPRLQRMLLQLQWYDVTIRYKSGKDMLFIDTMSRCPCRGSKERKSNWIWELPLWRPGLPSWRRQHGSSNSQHSVPVNPARLDTSMKAHSQDGQGILGLQRWTVNEWWLVTESTMYWSFHPASVSSTLSLWLQNVLLYHGFFDGCLTVLLAPCYFHVVPVALLGLFKLNCHDC